MTEKEEEDTLGYKLRGVHFSGYVPENASADDFPSPSGYAFDLLTKVKKRNQFQILSYL